MGGSEEVDPSVVGVDELQGLAKLDTLNGRGLKYNKTTIQVETRNLLLLYKTRTSFDTRFRHRYNNEPIINPRATTLPCQ